MEKWFTPISFLYQQIKETPDLPVDTEKQVFLFSSYYLFSSFFSPSPTPQINHLNFLKPDRISIVL